MLTFIGIENHADLVVVALNMLVSVAVVTFKSCMKNRSIFFKVGYYSAIPYLSGIDGCFHSSICDGCEFAVTFNVAVIGSGRRQYSPVFIKNFTVFGASAAKTVHAIGLDYCQFIFSLVNKFFSFNANVSHCAGSFHISYFV